MTQAAYDRLVEQHRVLTFGELVDAQQRLASIQDSGGDAEGLEGVEAVFDVERVAGEIERIARIIDNAEIVDGGGGEVVAHGCTVVLDAGDGPETYSFEDITGPGSISPHSPIGSAIVGLRAGARVDVAAPGGTYQVRILEIR